MNEKPHYVKADISIEAASNGYIVRDQGEHYQKTVFYTFRELVTYLGKKFEILKIGQEFEIPTANEIRAGGKK